VRRAPAQDIEQLTRATTTVHKLMRNGIYSFALCFRTSRCSTSETDTDGFSSDFGAERANRPNRRMLLTQDPTA
jgi:hypothetical protein